MHGAPFSQEWDGLRLQCSPARFFCTSGLARQTPPPQLLISLQTNLCKGQNYVNCGEFVKGFKHTNAFSVTPPPLGLNRAPTCTPAPPLVHILDFWTHINTEKGIENGHVEDHFNVSLVAPAIVFPPTCQWLDYPNQEGLRAPFHLIDGPTPSPHLS